MASYDVTLLHLRFAFVAKSCTYFLTLMKCPAQFMITLYLGQFAVARPAVYFSSALESIIVT